MENEFEMNVAGYLAAKDYLISIDKLGDFKSNAISIDGFSMIAYANKCLRQELDKPTPQASPDAS